jgi:hypothetical protein
MMKVGALRVEAEWAGQAAAEWGGTAEASAVEAAVGCPIARKWNGLVRPWTP